MFTLMPHQQHVHRHGTLLAGGIFEKIAKYGPPAVNKTEVVQMKRIPLPNYSLSIALQENALRVMCLLRETPGSAPG